MIDRSGLILDIFASRARTFEGKLQVELAQQPHSDTTDTWLDSLRTTEGGYWSEGARETQLETDRRLIANPYQLPKRRLEKFEKPAIRAAELAVGMAFRLNWSLDTRMLVNPRCSIDLLRQRSMRPISYSRLWIRRSEKSYSGWRRNDFGRHCWIRSKSATCLS